MNIKKIILSLVVLVFSTIITNAQKDRILFTLNGQNIYSSEFSKVYEKNLSLVTDASQKDVKNYLDLYVNYKLKLQEAYELKMDTVPSYLREYNKYKNQLIAPYLKDKDTERDLIQEAYDRTKEEVNVSHILVKLSRGATPSDTLKAFNKIKNAREMIIKGSAFEEIAKKVSEDPSVKQNGGELGFFNAFRMVYPFETAAYTTPIGEISQPFKTRFGYHIVKVNEKRVSKGEVEVAHIMLKEDNEANKKQIFKIKEELNNGADFADLAKSYSEDKGSAKKGGVLAKFGSGRMVKEFDEISFSLEKKGDISAPFKTRYGWHIVKLIKKYPVGTIDELRSEIKKKLVKGQRSNLIGQSVVNRLLKEYKIIQDDNLIKKYNNPEWNKSEDMTSEKTIFSVEGRQFTAKDFSEFYEKQGKGYPTAEKVFNKFKETKVLAYYKEKLPSQFPELKHTLKEYQEGLLLFDLMQDKIWEKAEKDTTGLKDFYNSHQNNYKWGERVAAVVITSAEKEAAIKAKDFLAAGKTLKEINTLLSDTTLVDIKEGLFEKTNPLFPNSFEYNMGMSEIIQNNNQFVVIKVNKIVAPQPKLLTETRGKVISDYQDYLETNWIKTLKQHYPVKINKKAYKKLVRKYK